MNFSELLNKSNLKATPARLNLLEYLDQSNKPVSIEQLQEKLSSVNLSTLYRSLNALSEKNIIEKSVINNQPFYQLKKHQHYIICKNCHKLEPLPLCPLNANLKNLLSEKTGFEMTEHKLELYGFCKKCLDTKSLQ